MPTTEYLKQKTRLQDVFKDKLSKEIPVPTVVKQEETDVADEDLNQVPLDTENVSENNEIETKTETEIKKTKTKSKR